MSLSLLSPWQQLLWLVCAFILIVPIIAAGVTTVIRGYFKAKREHTGQIAKSIANALNSISGELNKKLDDILGKVKEEVKKDAGKDA